MRLEAGSSSSWSASRSWPRRRRPIGRPGSRRRSSGSRGKGGKGKQRCGGRPATDPVPVLAIEARRADVPVYLDGVGTARALNTVTVRPQVEGKLIAISFTEGQDVPQGLRPRQDRSHHLPGAIRSGGGQEGAGRGAARQRPARSRTLHAARRHQRDQQAAGRHPARAGRPARSAGARRPGGDRQCARDPLLHRHHRADRRAAPASGRWTKATSCAPPTPPASSSSRRSSRSRCCSTCRSRSCRSSTAAWRKARCRSMRIGPDGRTPVDKRQGAGDRQPGRSDHRHGAAQGRIPQRQAAALARPVRQCAAADRHAAAGGGGADRGGAARPDRHLRLSSARTTTRSRCGR